MLELKETKLKNVGIYKDTTDPNVYILVMKDKTGTSYFSFGYSDFIRGWYEDAPQPTTRHFHPAKNLKAIGVINLMQKKLNQPLPPIVIEALMNFQVTPTILSRCGKTSPRKIKWIEPKRGNWGGRRN